VKIGKYELNHCYHEDCLPALKSLPDKSFDLCLTDPPYNNEFKGKGGCSFHDKRHDYSNDDDKVYYDDKMPDNEYKQFIKEVLSELLRVCNWIVITPGHRNLYWYIRETEPSYQIRFWYKKNDGNRITSEPILMYGKSNNAKCIPYVMEFNLVSLITEFNFDPIHPCPRCYDLWRFIIQQSRSRSIIDPFLGSGTTAQACEEIGGINWLGFEINEMYRPDIEKRIELGQSSRKRNGMQASVI
jgi:site-specific DNA-methyltransferase (adenine-specific)